jgi:hypothetical protein
VTDIREILRRRQLGEPDRRTARDLDVSRNTVARYRVRAARHGVLDGAALPIRRHSFCVSGAFLADVRLQQQPCPTGQRAILSGFWTETF